MINNRKTLNQPKFHHFNLQTYGVKIGIKIDTQLQPLELFHRLDTTFPTGFIEIRKDEIEHQFSVKRGKLKEYLLFDSEKEIYSTFDRENLIDFLDSHLRTTVAKFAIDKVFLHAGVVGWKGKAIVIPGKSFAGKTTLVAELVKRGAEYYSDEYAVFDKDGFVYPFPKKLSIRGIIDDFTQVDFAVEELNGKPGVKPLPVGIMLITEYEKGRNQRQRIIAQSKGRGMLDIMGHSFALKQNPQKVLLFLNKALNCGMILKTKRGEAKEFVDFFIKYIESNKLLSQEK
jgi:hypothetical protein